MKRAAGVLALVLVASLLGSSDVGASAGGATSAKTAGPVVVATIVIDLTGSGSYVEPKGLTSMRIQRSGASAAALFRSNASIFRDCAQVLADGVNGTFVGKLDGWVPPGVLTALFGASGATAVITDTDYATCTDVVLDGYPSPGIRNVLSFVATIQFEK